MAAASEVINDELIFMFKSLAESIKQHPYYNSDKLNIFGNSLQLLASTLNGLTENQIVVRLFGSEAEDLKCIESNDLGDLDIMIFPNSDNMIIHQELLEYSRENPLHVRIKAGDHSVLRSCILEETEYVATSALKNFNPEIFGALSRVLFETLSSRLETFSQEELLTFAVTRLKNNTTSPAATFHVAGSGMKQKKADMIIPFELIELVAVLVCSFKGTNYTRQHASILDNIILLLRDIKTAVDPISVFHRIFSCLQLYLGRETYSEAEMQFIAQLEEIVRQGLPQNKPLQDIEEQYVTPLKRGEVESERSTGNHWSLPDTAQNYYVNQSSESLKASLNQLKMSKESRGLEDNDVKKPENGDRNDSGETGQKGEMASTGLPKNPDSEEEGEINGAGLKLCTGLLTNWLKHLGGKGTETKEYQTQETINKNTEQFKSGFDIIPAFRSSGWPKVAKEWIKRERKWPSPNIVDKVIKEGFHLVVKAPKDNGNPDCDFRISFSHAERLLSQEMNDIQRECYRCFKRYHRAHLSTQPKSLVSFHLKNLFLQTIEETGAEMWTECNRAKCMMKLLGNLLKALRRNDLRHFFVRSYNLFGEDYIENSEILQTLAGKVEHFIESPVQILNELTENTVVSQFEHALRNGWEKLFSNVPSSEPTLPANSATRQRHEEIEDVLFKGNDDTYSKKEKATAPLPSSQATQDRSPIASYRYHDLKDVYQEVTKELVNVAFNDADCRLETLDPIETSLVEDLRVLGRKHDVTNPVEGFLEVFSVFWDEITFFRVMGSTEEDLRRRILDAVQGLVEIMKHAWKEGDIADFKTAWRRIFHDMIAENSFHLNHILPSGFLIPMIRRFVDGVFAKQVVYDIPLD